MVNRLIDAYRSSLIGYQTVCNSFRALQSFKPLRDNVPPPLCVPPLLICHRPSPPPPPTTYLNHPFIFHHHHLLSTDPCVPPPLIYYRPPPPHTCTTPYLTPPPLKKVYTRKVRGYQRAHETNHPKYETFKPAFVLASLCCHGRRETAAASCHILQIGFNRLRAFNTVVDQSFGPHWSHQPVRGLHQPVAASAPPGAASARRRAAHQDDA